MKRKNFAIFNDEDFNNLIMVEDNFRTEEDAEKYANENGLVGEYYFVGECDDVEEEEFKNE